ncbi:MAG TPA: hypothetical protein VII02_08705 [Gemmatimonadaceae bacterium]
MAHSDRKHSAEKNVDANHKAPSKRRAKHDPVKETKPNPPRTTTDGWLTVPKFGSAGSGGAELEPGPERD